MSVGAMAFLQCMQSSSTLEAVDFWDCNMADPVHPVCMPVLAARSRGKSAGGGKKSKKGGKSKGSKASKVSAKGERQVSGELYIPPPPLRLRHCFVHVLPRKSWMVHTLSVGCFRLTIYSLIQLLCFGNLACIGNDLDSSISTYRRLCTAPWKCHFWASMAIAGAGCATIPGVEPTAAVKVAALLAQRIYAQPAVAGDASTAVSTASRRCVPARCHIVANFRNFCLSCLGILSVHHCSRPSGGVTPKQPNQATLFPSFPARPDTFAHVPPPLPAAPMHARTLPPARFAALWTATDLATASREWQLRLVAVVARCLWLAPAQCCEMVEDLVEQHGWEHAEEPSIHVRALPGVPRNAILLCIS